VAARPAARKVELLLSAGARVTLIADTVIGEIAHMIAEAALPGPGAASMPPTSRQCR